MDSLPVLRACVHDNKAVEQQMHGSCFDDRICNVTRHQSEQHPGPRGQGCRQHRDAPARLSCSRQQQFVMIRL